MRNNTPLKLRVIHICFKVLHIFFQILRSHYVDFSKNTLRFVFLKRLNRTILEHTVRRGQAAKLHIHDFNFTRFCGFYFFSQCVLHHKYLITILINCLLLTKQQSNLSLVIFLPIFSFYRTFSSKPNSTNGYL